MKRVTFFTRGECHLCDAALFVVQRVRSAVPFELEVVDVDAPGCDAVRSAYGNDVPVVHVDGREFCRHRVEERALRRRLAEG